MLQEKLYPDWAKPGRKWWNNRYNRIILFWIIVVVSSFIVLFVIATDYINWDRLNRDFLHSNEISRAFLASFILVMDITIVMQVNNSGEIWPSGKLPFECQKIAKNLTFKKKKSQVFGNFLTYKTLMSYRSLKHQNN